MNKTIITSISVGFGITCLVWGLLWMMMAKDLKEQLIKLEEEVIQLRWENENNYTYCEVE
jgi:hypothetical protein